jgi:hypothetical protein
MEASPLAIDLLGAASEGTRSPTAIIVRIKLLSLSEVEQFSPDEPNNAVIRDGSTSSGML